ncbi:kelch-like protein 23 [Synchiropus splendidus]|uniref:kelch-like protein 23 n=1 Tax=Synchiropus splendidus TaxID=270530 RepID=UPI00237E62EB|nr:kelch-like protein 23 [Synchiropus splendidus]XP_053733319.1 kelch-like protein 23 [Synchiropus splendidus]
MSFSQEEIYTYDFSDGLHPQELLEALRHFYRTGLFTDVSLQCGDSGQLFHCHKALLSARSAYFKVMFTADMKERSNTVIQLTGVDGSILEALVNYVYTAQVSITESNVQSLLEAADLLQFANVKQACERFLIRLLDVYNCSGMHAFAQLHQCPALEKEAWRLMVSKFAELTQQEEFLEMDPDRLRSLLTAQNVNVHRGDVLIEAVTQWVHHDLDRRIHLTVELLRLLHLDLNEVQFQATLEVHGDCLLRDHGKFKSMIVRASRPDGSAFTNRKTTSSLFIIGGYYWRPLGEVHMWDPLSDTWLQGKDMPDQEIESYSVAVLGANIYVTGGYRTHTVEALDSVFVYDSDSDDWSEGPRMLTARYYHCSVPLHGCVYAIGGYRGGAPEQESEFYDPLKKKWFPVAKMIHGVGNAAASVMGDRIYVAGGHNGYRGSCTNEKIQVYRPDTNEWSVITSIPHPEYGLCSVPLDKKLYFVGGQSTTADCYDTVRDEWKSISAMKESRMECGAAVINNCIYVTGGYSYSKGTYLQSIEKYDPDLDSWEIVGTLPSSARSHGCVSVCTL